MTKKNQQLAGSLCLLLAAFIWGISFVAQTTGMEYVGPFTFQGVILGPVVGWTTHHSILEYKGQWYLFHHDCVPSNGTTWLRSLKVMPLHYDSTGHILRMKSE